MHPIAPHVDGSVLMLMVAIFCIGLGIYFLVSSDAALSDDDEDDWVF